MCNHIQAVRLWIRNRRRYIGLVVLFFPLECGAARRPAPPSHGAVEAGTQTAALVNRHPTIDARANQS